MAKKPTTTPAKLRAKRTTEGLIAPTKLRARLRGPVTLVGHQDPAPQRTTEGLPKHLVVVDMVVRRGNSILLIRRGNEPFKGFQALPGGFVEPGEAVEKAASRELKEETGIDIAPDKWKLVGIYSAADRDPRGHVIAVAFTAWVPSHAAPAAGDDAESAMFSENWHGYPLAFDHEQIIQDALS